MRRFSVLLILLMFLPLAGCGASAGAILLGGTVATYVNTDKLPADHITSYATGQDCDAVRASQGGDYCKDEEDPEMQVMRDAESHPYCYRTLGKITCYDTPDPYSENNIPVR